MIKSAFMKKLLIPLLTVIVIPFCLLSCSRNKSKVDDESYEAYCDSMYRAKAIEDSLAALPKWEVVALEDKFGDPTGDTAWVKDFVDGSFSNSATSSSRLTGWLKKEKGGKYLIIALYEYGRSNSTIYDDLTATLEFKDDDGKLRKITEADATFDNKVWFKKGQKDILLHAGPRKYILTLKGDYSESTYRFTFDATGFPSEVLNGSKK